MSKLFQISYFKFSPSNKGSALGVNFDFPTKALYFNLLKQHSWNAESKTGSCSESRGKPDREVKVKFSLTEAAGILLFLNNKVSFKFFHVSPKGTTNGQVSEYKDGASIAVNKGKKDEGGVNFVIGLNAAESKLLAIFIDEGVRRCFDGNTTIEKEVE